MKSADQGNDSAKLAPWEDAHRRERRVERFQIRMGLIADLKEKGNKEAAIWRDKLENFTWSLSNSSSEGGLSRK